MQPPKLSTLLTSLAFLLMLTSRSWSGWLNYLRGARRTLSQIDQDIRSGKEPPMSVYARIAVCVSMALFIAGVYVSCSGR